MAKTQLRQGCQGIKRLLAHCEGCWHNVEVVGTIVKVVGTIVKVVGTTVKVVGTM